jgi:hypothetical protein
MVTILLPSPLYAFPVYFLSVLPFKTDGGFHKRKEGEGVGEGEGE